MSLLKKNKSSSLAIASWCIFDWGMSAFPIVIITFVYGTYFVRSVAHSTVHGTALWGWTIGISAILIAIFSPIFGSIADYTGQRKLWLATFLFFNVIATALLFFAKPNPAYVLWVLLFLGVANVCYEFSQVFYNAMLPSIAPNDKIGRISGWGWASGYFGGLVCLTIALLGLIQNKQFSKINDVNVRSSAILVSLWIFIFTLPLFLFTNDTAKNDIRAIDAIKRGIHELIKTFKELKKYRTIFTFLIARLIYIDGLNTLFIFAGIYAGGAFNMNYTQILLFAILLNISAAIGAAYFSIVDDRWGSKKTICLSLIIIIISGSILLMIKSKALFWILSVILGLFVGPTQSASRSFMARIAPKHLTNQMFGIYQFSGRITSFVGPVLVASLTEIFDSQRMGMSIIFILMFIGFLLLLKVKEIKSAVD